MQQLALEIQHLVADMPYELAERLASILDSQDTANRSHLRIQMLNEVAPPAVRERLSRFLDFWQKNASQVKPASVALALLSAAQAAEHDRRCQSLELVWTGPDSQVIPLRRTDQALLQLINEARADLHIVSFAVYKAEFIAEALIQAAQHGVSIFIYLETPEVSEGKIAFDTIGALGREIKRHARIYVWPLEQRTLSMDGKHGSLHAKIAVADSRSMLVSSANLTAYAMQLNMELGLLVQGGLLPAQVRAHLVRLVDKGIFLRV